MLRIRLTDEQAVELARLRRAAVAQQRQHCGDQIGARLQAIERRAGRGGRGTATGGTAIAALGVAMLLDGPLVDSETDLGITEDDWDGMAQGVVRPPAMQPGGTMKVGIRNVLTFPPR